MKTPHKGIIKNKNDDKPSEKIKPTLGSIFVFGLLKLQIVITK